jgi:hypothetical protein
METFDHTDFATGSDTERRSKLRTEHSSLFRLADRCALVSLDIAALLPLARANRQIFMSQLFARALSHFQAALMLSESGLVIESLTLSRSLHIHLVRGHLCR